MKIGQKKNFLTRFGPSRIFGSRKFSKKNDKKRSKKWFFEKCQNSQNSLFWHFFDKFSKNIFFDFFFKKCQNSQNSLFWHYFDKFSKNIFFRFFFQKVSKQQKYPADFQKIFFWKFLSKSVKKFNLKNIKKIFFLIFKKKI